MPVTTGDAVRTNAGSVAQGQTLKTFTGRTTLSASVTTTQALYTVTAGKVFYVTDVYFASTQAAELDIQIQAAGATIFRCSCFATSPVEYPGIESQPSATSAQAVTILFPIAAGPPSVNWFVSGFEQ